MAGIIGIIKSWGIIKNAVGLAAKEMGGMADAETNVKRTQRDLSMKISSGDMEPTVAVISGFHWFSTLSPQIRDMPGMIIHHTASEPAQMIEAYFSPTI